MIPIPWDSTTDSLQASHLRVEIIHTNFLDFGRSVGQLLFSYNSKDLKRNTYLNRYYYTYICPKEVPILMLNFQIRIGTQINNTKVYLFNTKLLNSAALLYIILIPCGPLLSTAGIYFVPTSIEQKHIYFRKLIITYITNKSVSLDRRTTKFSMVPSIF